MLHGNLLKIICNRAESRSLPLFSAVDYEPLNAEYQTKTARLVGRAVESIAIYIFG